MNKFSKALTGILKRGGLAFSCFPASMGFAILMAGLSIWAVYTEPNTYTKLLLSLQITFMASSLVGITFSVLSRKLSGSRPSFTFFNLLTLAFACLSFISLYLLGNSKSEPSMRVASIVIAAGAIALIAFVVIPTFRSKVIDYNKMFFMTFKAFFISVLYTGVLMGGFAFVAFAVQMLLWADMTEKVYIYIVILSLLIGYAFFLGYFPNFRREEDEEFTARAEVAVRQPRFAEVLFQNIMIPIHSVLSVVLLIWSVKIVITRVWPAYGQVIGIFTAYSLFSILLYILVSSYDTKIVMWYRRIVPIATLVFLAFEIYPIYTKLSESGLQPLEYAVICVWVFAAIVSACFIFIPIVKNRIAAYIAAALIGLFVLPFIGAMDASYYSQSLRLKNALERNAMTSGGDITPSAAVSKEDKVIITEAVNYLYSDVDKPAPAWIISEMASLSDFYSVFGFNEYYRTDPDNDNPDNVDSSLTIAVAPGVADIQGYDFYLSRDAFNKSELITVTSGGIDYTVSYQMGNGAMSAPVVKVTEGNTVLIEADLNDFAAEIYDLYSGQGTGSKGGYLELDTGKLSFEKSGGGVTILIFVESANYNISNGVVQSLNIDIRGICFK
ncbi:MAG: hypothetical protein ACYCYM_02470 [Saccharofermentanales bacterium]